MCDQEGLQRVALFGVAAETLLESGPILGPIHIVALSKVVARPRHVVYELGFVEQSSQRTPHGLLQWSAFHVDQQSARLHSPRAPILLQRESEERRQGLIPVCSPLVLQQQLVPEVVADLVA